MEEPSLIAQCQLANLRVLFVGLLSLTAVRRLCVRAPQPSDSARDALAGIAADFGVRGLEVFIQFLPGLHTRALTYDRRVVVVSDRGLDPFMASRKAPPMCRGGDVVTYMLDDPPTI